MQALGLGVGQSQPGVRQSASTLRAPKLGGAEGQGGPVAQR